MAGLSAFGIVHTVISLVAVSAGIAAFIRHGEITWRNSVGKTYVVMTALTCITGFFIFHHGGFGKPHELGIITLVVLGLAYTGGQHRFGRASRYVETICYTMTFFFHFIPFVTETLTRLPVDAPIASGPDDPLVQNLVGLCFLLFLIGVTIQVIHLRKGAGSKDGAIA